MSGQGLTEPIVSMSEAQAYVRIETGEEEALLAGLIRTASALCESFIGEAVVSRGFAVDVPASACWQRLSVLPVRSITSVETIAAGGSAVALPVESYAVDIDASGIGWVRLTSPIEQNRLRVSGVMGLASGRNEVPEPLRQGVLRLVAHLFATRDGGGGSPPAAVTALWRPYRRTRLF